MPLDPRADESYYRIPPPVASECQDTDGDGDCPICVHGQWRCPKKMKVTDAPIQP